MALAPVVSGAEIFGLTLNPTDNAYYRACEWQVDVFGGGGSKDFDSFDDPSRGFAGVGLNFYPSLNFGVGISGSARSAHKNVADDIAYDLYARVPIGRVAIYALGGVSSTTRHMDRLSAQGGGGLEFRFSRRVGFFGETRAINDLDGNWRPSHRGGLRLSF